MRSFRVACGLILVASLAFAGGGRESDEIVLRVASASLGPATMDIFMDGVAEFEAANPGVTVEWDTSAGDDYQFAGLPSLLESDTPPDLFFEWGGNRVANHVADGYAMDVSDLAEELRPDFSNSAWTGFEFDGGVYGIPLAQDITIQMWYNASFFDEVGISPPTTWDEFMTVNEALLDAGVTPIVMGNADAWVAGNFVGLMLYRVAGNDKAQAIMNLEPGYSLADPDFVEALEIAYQMGQAGYVNADMNTLGYAESFPLIVDGTAAMYPLGSWYPSEIEYVGIPFEEIGHDYFMLPPIPGGSGDQSSILGLNTGYVVNAGTEHKDLVYDLVRVLFGRDQMARHSAEASTIVARPAANVGESEVARRMVADLASSTSVVAPPDTGYNLEMAGALYEAIARVFEGEVTPQVALEEAEARINYLRE
jgi:raffinose/stachyose/melibiose transport system substrate-binding protein